MGFGHVDSLLLGEFGLSFAVTHSFGGRRSLLAKAGHAITVEISNQANGAENAR